MDTPALLGAALAFSAVSLPIILILFTKNITKDIALSESRMEKIINDKLASFEKNLNLHHKKLAVDTLDRISSRLVKIADKIDPKILDNLYDD